MYCHALCRSRAACGCARSRPPGGWKPRKHLYTARTPSGRGAGRRALAMDAAAGALEARHRPARAPVPQDARGAPRAAQPLEHHLLMPHRMVTDDERFGGLRGMVYLVWKLTMSTPEAAAWKTCARPRRHHRMMRSAGTSGVRSAERERVVTGQEIIGRQEIMGTSRII